MGSFGVEAFDFENYTTEEILANLETVHNKYELEQTKKNIESDIKTFEREQRRIEAEKEIEQQKKKSEHVRIAKAIQSDYNIKYYSGQFYLYNNFGCYTPDLPKLEQEIIKQSNNSSIHLRKEVLDYLRIINTVDKNAINTDYINFNNCLFNLKDRKAHAYSPDIFTTCQLQVKYIPDSELKINKDIEEFLDEITCKDSERKTAILQFLGYSMTFITDCQKACFLYSTRGGTGKSTLLEIIETIFGDKNSCSISLKQYSEKFTVSNIVDKLLNSVHETPKKIVSDIENFKAAVCGNKMTLEKKYINATECYPFVKNWFAMNRLPQLAEGIADDSYYRRLLIIKFNASFSQKDKDNFNIEKLLNQKALDYLANIALREYLKMLDNNTKAFANAKESKTIINYYKNSSSSISMFLSDFTLNFNINQEIKRYEMYKKYECWCNQNNMSVEKKSEFYDHILDSGLFHEHEHQKNKYFEYIEQEKIDTNNNIEEGEE